MHYQLFVLMVYEELRIQSKQSTYRVAEKTNTFPDRTIRPADLGLVS